MKPLQVYLSDRELDRLANWARRKGWTKSHAVRVAIRALVREHDEDPLLAASGMIEGLPEDLSERFDAYFKETFVAESSPRYRRSARPPRKPRRSVR